MPTIEFIGFGADDQQRIHRELRERYGNLHFRQDIVFVIDETPTRRVEAWTYDQAPFVRVSSRSTERLSVLVERTRSLCDTETVVIGFYPHEDRSDVQSSSP